MLRKSLGRSKEKDSDKEKDKHEHMNREIEAREKESKEREGKEKEIKREGSVKSLDAETNLPIKPWNANVKAYTTKEPSIPWFKRQSRAPVWTDQLPVAKETLNRVTSFKDEVRELHSKSSRDLTGNNRHSTGTMGKAKSLSPANQKRVKLNDIRGSKLFRQISRDHNDGEMFDWSVNAAASNPTSPAASNKNLKPLIENNHPNQPKATVKQKQSPGDNGISPISIADVDLNLGDVYKADTDAEVNAVVNVTRKGRSTSSSEISQFSDESHPSSSSSANRRHSYADMLHKSSEDRKTVFESIRNFISRRASLTPNSEVGRIESPTVQNMQSRKLSESPRPETMSSEMLFTRPDRSDSRVSQNGIIIENNKSLVEQDQQFTKEVSPIKKNQDEDVEVEVAHDSSLNFDADEVYEDAKMADAFVSDHLDLQLNSVYEVPNSKDFDQKVTHDGLDSQDKLVQESMVTNDVDLNMNSVSDAPNSDVKSLEQNDAISKERGISSLDDYITTEDVDLDMDSIYDDPNSDSNVTDKRSSYAGQTNGMSFFNENLIAEDVDVDMDSIYDDPSSPKANGRLQNQLSSHSELPEDDDEEEIIEEEIVNIDTIYDEQHYGDHADGSLLNFSDSTTINDQSSNIRNITLRNNSLIHGYVNESKQDTTIDMGDIYDNDAVFAKKSTSVTKDVDDISPLKFTQMNDMVWASPSSEIEQTEKTKNNQNISASDVRFTIPNVQSSISSRAPTFHENSLVLKSDVNNHTTTSIPPISPSSGAQIQSSDRSHRSRTVSSSNSSESIFPHLDTREGSRKLLNVMSESDMTESSNLSTEPQMDIGDIYDQELHKETPEPIAASSYFAPRAALLLSGSHNSANFHHRAISPGQQSFTSSLTNSDDDLAKEESFLQNSNRMDSVTTIRKSDADYLLQPPRDYGLKRMPSVRVDLGDIYDEDTSQPIEGVAMEVEPPIESNQNHRVSWRKRDEIGTVVPAQGFESRPASQRVIKPLTSVNRLSRNVNASPEPKTYDASPRSPPQQLGIPTLTRLLGISAAKQRAEAEKKEINPEIFTFDMSDLRNEFMEKDRGRASSNASISSLHSLNSLNSRRSISSSPSAVEGRSRSSLSIDSVSKSMISHRHEEEQKNRRSVRRASVGSLPPLGPLLNVQLDGKFELATECMICQSDISNLNINEHLRHIYCCAESSHASLLTALAQKAELEKATSSISDPQEHIIEVSQNLQKISSKDSTSETPFGTPFETPNPREPIKIIKVTMDTGTQTAGAFVDDSILGFESAQSPRSPVNPALEQQKHKRSRDITNKVNLINQQRTQLVSQLLNNDDEMNLYNVYPTTLQPVVEEEVYPKPSMALQGDRAARLKEEKARRFNLVGPDVLGDEVDVQELAKLRQELTELLAKQSEIRVKEHLLRTVIKKSLGKAKVEDDPLLADSPRAKAAKSKRSSKKIKDDKGMKTDEQKQTEKPETTAPPPVPEVELPEHLKKFQLMLKRGVPVAAVVAKMTLDAITPDDQKVVLKTLEPPGPPEAEVPEHIKKFQLMLKRGVPAPAVILKMNMEGISPEDQKIILKSPDAPAAPAPVVPPPPPAEPELPEHLKKYKLMLQRGVPPPAVAAKMNLDKIPPEEQKLVMKSLEAPAPSGLRKGSDASVSSVESAAAGPKLIGLFWDVIEKEKIEASESNVWKIIAASKPAAVLQDAEWNQLVNMFTKKEIGKKKTNTETSNAKEGTAGVRKVLDFARSVSISIVLSVFKSRNMEISRICEGVNNMDFHYIQIDDALRVKDILPTEQEVKQFKELSKTKGFKVEDLVEVEQAMYKLCQVERLKEKLGVLMFLLTWGSTIGNFTRRCEILAQTTEAACSSEGLRELFHVILSIGNSLNTGTSKGGALGYKVSSLSKLNQTKSSNNIQSVLDFLVQILYSREKLGDKSSLRALSVDEELISGLEFSKSILMSDLELEMKSFESNMRQFHEILQKEWDDPDSQNSQMNALKDQHKAVSTAVSNAREHIERAKKDVKKFEQFYFEAPDSCQKMLKDFNDFILELKKSKEKYLIMQRANNKHPNPLSKTKTSSQRPPLPPRRKSLHV